MEMLLCICRREVVILDLGWGLGVGDTYFFGLEMELIVVGEMRFLEKFKMEGKGSEYRVLGFIMERFGRGG